MRVRRTFDYRRERKPWHVTQLRVVELGMLDSATDDRRILGELHDPSSRFDGRHATKVVRRKGNDLVAMIRDGESVQKPCPARQPLDHSVSGRGERGVERREVREPPRAL